MLRKRRVIAAAMLALLCLPGNVLREEVPRGPSWDIEVTQVEGPSKKSIDGWTLQGVWEAKADTLMFGGFSALLPLGENTLRAFSDRGTRLTLTEPDQPQEVGNVVRQIVTAGRRRELWDIESATRDPETGQYWLGFENVHTVHRFTSASEADRLRDLDDEVGWTVNSGAEALVRLADGRFIILPEGAREGLVFDQDPVAGDAFETFPYQTPAASYAVTDMVQLPDGRLLLLLRNLVWGVPPFDSLLAIGEPPRGGQTEPFAPSITLDLTKVIPAENYEGLAVRERTDGDLDVWLISDDNLAAMQRTLIVKLRFDPDFAKTLSRKKQKARE